MGNCRSKSTSSSSAPAGKSSKHHRHLPLHRTATDTTTASSVSSNASTSALVHSFFAIAQPIIRRVISKRLIEDVGVLRDEIPVETYDEDQPDDTLPIKPIFVEFEDVHVVDPATLRADMEAMPDFEWPEPERYEQLMTHCTEGGSVDMVVLDLMEFDGELRFDKGVEIAVPVKGPFGTQMELEIGYEGYGEGKIEEAWVRIRVPQLRIWYVNETKKMYVAFMARPDLVPMMNVNVDRGKGDFLSVNFTEEGGLDDVVEKILSGFGPNLKQKPDEKTSFVGNRVGELVVQAMSKFKNMGNGRPLEVTLEEAIRKSINKAMGKPRPADTIKADIKRLEAELERSEREYQPKSKWKDRLHLHHHSNNTDQEENRDDDVGNFCGMHTMWCCGSGAAPRE